MITLLLVGLSVVGAISFVSLLLALAYARDGYEDNTGFHGDPTGLEDEKTWTVPAGSKHSGSPDMGPAEPVLF
jgi:hypothetical protein